MSHSVRLGLTALLISSFAIGCAVGVDDGDTAGVVTIQDTSSAPASPPSAGGDEADPSARVGGDPVYFGEANALEGTSDVDTPPSYSFELVADAHMTIELSRRNEDGPNTIGFTLYRVTDGDANVELGSAYGQYGSAAVSLYTVHGGTYAIQLINGLKPETLVLHLDCNSGTCAPRRQPGEVCGDGSAMQCDKGLVCLFEDGACQQPEEPGHCQIAPADCASKYAPVCGCDGRTWGNDCFARQAGVSILSSGECEAN